MYIFSLRISTQRPIYFISGAWSFQDYLLQSKDLKFHFLLRCFLPCETELTIITSSEFMSQMLVFLCGNHGHFCRMDVLCKLSVNGSNKSTGHNKNTFLVPFYLSSFMTIVIDQSSSVVRLAESC